jgi:hypothetical protein
MMREHLHVFSELKAPTGTAVAVTALSPIAGFSFFSKNQSKMLVMQKK